MASFSKEARIIDEVREKSAEFESAQSGYLSEIGEFADHYRIKKLPRKSGAFSNPRSTEFYRASNALSTMMYRMMTAQDNYFSPIPVQMDADYGALYRIQSALLAQDRAADYKRNLYRACSFVVPFGTVICQEDYRSFGVSTFGRRIPATAMVPRAIDQVMFDLGTTDIKNADWVSTADIVSNADLMRMKSDASLVGSPWNTEALDAATALSEDSTTINPYVLMRLQRSGINDDTMARKKRELLMYYGKLDTLNDGIEYVCALVNRKILVRFHANNFQHGMRPFRVAKWQDFDGPLGLGLGNIIGSLQKSIDGNFQRITDNLAMASYNMWEREKNSVLDDDLVIQPLNIVDSEKIGSIRPLPVETKGAEASMTLMEIQKQEARAASGATDTLQAIITNATASETSLAMNEAMRNVSVKTELAAEGLMREHLEAAHANNAQFLNEPLNIASSMGPMWVYPAELRFDVDFQLKITTDKDFRPQRLDKLINTLQILVSTKSQHPDQMAISILPIVKQIAQMLDVNPDEVVTGAAGMAPGMIPTIGGPQDIMGMSQMTAPGMGGADIVSTPVGPTLASPQ